MNDFWLFFQLGWQHILDWQGYDHILFVAVLCGTYQLKEWRKILILVTAFTVGHSVTLALSIFNKILIPSDWIEFLIPITIVFTALLNLKDRTKKVKKEMNFNYVLALIFGLIHGMGFSNYLKSLMGKNSNIITELLAFNLGLEFGQILIVISVLLISYAVINIIRTPKREWNLFLSSAIFGIALVMALDRIPF